MSVIVPALWGVLSNSEVSLWEGLSDSEVSLCSHSKRRGPAGHTGRPGWRCSRWSRRRPAPSCHEPLSAGTRRASHRVSTLSDDLSLSLCFTYSLILSLSLSLTHIHINFLTNANNILTYTHTQLSMSITHTHAYNSYS